MPGMMDSVLNLGMHDGMLERFIERTGDPCFVYDCYRRFLQSYSTVVLRLCPSMFENEIDSLKDLSVTSLKDLCTSFKGLIHRYGKRIPSNTHAQLTETIRAVFKSWDSDLAKLYRSENSIPNVGTAVSVQAMVYGNRCQDSLTGVILTKDCITGFNNITGEYLMHSQGEDIVGGYEIPNPISVYSSIEIARNLKYTEDDRLIKLKSLEEINPNLYTELKKLSLTLENHYKEAQEVEFTVDSGKIWILQTRSANKTKEAELVIQTGFFSRDIISEEELISRTSHIKKEDRLIFSLGDKDKVLASGLAPSSGLAVGRITLDPSKACEKTPYPKILVREQTDTKDLEAILASHGTLTAKGGTTSHAAVVCRGASICCIVGAPIKLDTFNKKVQIGDELFSEGDWISLDGYSGYIYKGKLEVEQVR